MLLIFYDLHIVYCILYIATICLEPWHYLSIELLSNILTTAAYYVTFILPAAAVIMLSAMASPSLISDPNRSNQSMLRLSSIPFWMTNLSLHRLRLVLHSPLDPPLHVTQREDAGAAPV